MVDSADRERMWIVKDELHRCLKEEALRNVVVLIFANKQDLPNAMSIDEIQDKLDLSYYVQQSPELLKSLKTDTLLGMLPDGIIDILSSYTPHKQCKVVHGTYLKWDNIFPYGTVGHTVFRQESWSLMYKNGRIVAEYCPPYEIEIGNQICEIFSSCAKTGDGLWEGINWMSLQLNNAKLKKDCVIL